MMIITPALDRRPITFEEKPKQRPPHPISVYSSLRTKYMYSSNPPTKGSTTAAALSIIWCKYMRVD